MNEEELLKRLQEELEKTEIGVLESKLQELHRRKLGPDCLLFPTYRARVDKAIGMIAAELKKRREKPPSVDEGDPSEKVWNDYVSRGEKP